MRRTATIDTSCLIALYHLGLLTHLSVLFERVHIPKRVREEISKKRSQKRRVISLLRRTALYHRCDVADSVRVDLLLQQRKGRSRGPKADRGEAEAVVQATEIDASIVLVDDPLGREWAKGHRVESHGLLWLLREFRKIEVLIELRSAFRILRKIGYRLPEEEIRNLLGEFGEL